MIKTTMPSTETKKRESHFQYSFQGAEKVEERLQQILECSEGIIREECMHLLNSGGKRLRPMLVLLSGMCFSDLKYSLVDAAVAAELIHMASLVHDDIIDNSDSRRGMVTINSLFGNHAAVLAGDFMFAKSFEILSSISQVKCMKLMVEAIEEMSMGEINQAEDMFNTSVSEDRYFKRIMGKTGILLSSCCGAGAAAGGASESEIELLGKFGMNIGYAFQIVDDILDFTGDERLLGKPVGKDLMTGVITLPVIILLRNGNCEDVKSIIQKGYIGREEFNYIRDCLMKYRVLEKTYEIARNFCKKASICLSSIPSSVCREKLMEIADKITARGY